MSKYRQKGVDRLSDYKKLAAEDHWYLVETPEQGKPPFAVYRGDSMIVHECTDDKRGFSYRKKIGLIWRRVPDWMEKPCPWCHQVAPQSLRSLWYLHNIDHVAVL